MKGLSGCAVSSQELNHVLALPLLHCFPIALASNFAVQFISPIVIRINAIPCQVWFEGILSGVLFQFDILLAPILSQTSL